MALPLSQPVQDRIIRTKSPHPKRPSTHILPSNAAAASSSSTDRPPLPSRPSRSSRRLSQAQRKSSVTSKGSSRTPSRATSRAPSRTPSVSHTMGKSRGQRPSAFGLEVTLTPTTGRISKALKGKRVHRCLECTKVFTRNEHLERHRSNHDPVPRFPCKVAGCLKQFKREDLLNRHLEKEGDAPHQQEFESLVREKTRNRNQSVEPLLDPMFSFGLAEPLVPEYIEGSSMPLSVAPLLTSTHSAQSPGSHPHSLYSSHDASLSQDQFSLAAEPAALYSYTMASQPQLIPGPFPAPPLSYTRSEESAPASPYSLEYSHRTIQSQLTAPPATNCAASPLDLALTWSLATKSPVPEAQSHSSPWSLEDPFSLSSDLTLIPFQDNSFLSLNIPETMPLAQGQASDLQSAIDSMDDVPLDELRGLFLRASEMDQQNLSPPIVDRLENLLDLYWKYFDSQLPVVHKATFLRRPQGKVNPLLLAAMASLGAQYGTVDERDFATSAHQNTKELLATRDPNSSEFSVSDMQATLLVEYFAKFRSKRIDVEPSVHFKSLYNRLCGDPRLVSSARAKISDNQEDWYDWLDLETQRRMLLASFLLDSKQSLLFDNKMIRPRIFDEMNMLLPCEQSFWEATSAVDWNLVTPTATNEHRGTLRAFASSYSVPYNGQSHVDDFTTALITSFYAIQESPGKHISPMSLLPPQVSSNAFALTHTVLTLTPLRSLLAVVSSTWVFGRKITDEARFDQMKAELRQWVDNRTQSQKAAWYASKVLRTVVQNGIKSLGDNIETGWCIYICSLVCWAFAYGLSPPDRDNIPRTTFAEEQACQTFLSHLNTPSWEAVQAVPRRWEALALLRWVRRRLDGNNSGLLLDANEILGKLGEGSRGELF